ncbi:inner-membrane translocator [Streptomyces sp. NPDC051243]|uniref:inner-membrane translocator n=1 Tax=Streptomyces sp. NPDC051243 TaxID=3365646 RepID=UPI003790DE97
MAPPSDEQLSDRTDVFTSGCLFLLVLLADVAAALLVVIVLAVRGLGRVDAGVMHQPVRPPVADWTPVWCWGALALAVGVTGFLLLRLGCRAIGAVQLVLCVVLAGSALSAWP